MRVGNCLAGLTINCIKEQNAIVGSWHLADVLDCAEECPLFGSKADMRPAPTPSQKTRGRHGPPGSS